MSADVAAILAIMLTAFTLSHVARTIVLLDEREPPVPDVDDSVVWSVQPPPPPPSLDEALGVVIAAGERVRRCLKCKSLATDIQWLGFTWSGSTVWAAVKEDCIECGNTANYNVPRMLWACMETSSTWEAMRSAAALFESEQSDSLDMPID